MITKELLEETIRKVLGEFKRTKRIPEPAADELSAALEARVDDLFDQDAAFQLVNAAPVPYPASDAEFEADMQALADGTEDLWNPEVSGDVQGQGIHIALVQAPQAAIGFFSVDDFLEAGEVVPGAVEQRAGGFNFSVQYA
ncbi:MAG TPA: hypothetical protein VN687_13075 [Blastocatellia bacterium]|nr:hypothetical protein [Blastocatellia bacterium]